MTSSHRERCLVRLFSEESQEALKWAKEVAEEREEFWRREAGYYASFVRKQSDLSNAKSYARVKRALSALLEPKFDTRDLKASDPRDWKVEAHDITSAARKLLPANDEEENDQSPSVEAKEKPMPNSNCPTCKGLGGYPNCPTCHNGPAKENLLRPSPAPPCSTSSDTPESMAACYDDEHGEPCVPLATAVKLERERAELLTLARFVADQMDASECQCVTPPDDPASERPEDHADYCPVYIAYHCRCHLLPNVKEHATPLAGAGVETGLEVHTTGDSADKAASGGCVSRLVRNSSFPLGPCDRLEISKIGLYEYKVMAAGNAWWEFFRLLNDNMGSILDIRMTPQNFPASVVTNPSALERNQRWLRQDDSRPPNPSGEPPDCNHSQTRSDTNSP